jgi:hypothetical protein
LHCTPNSHMWEISVNNQQVKHQLMISDLRFSHQWLWRVPRIFWDITPYSLVKVNRCFGRTYYHVTICFWILAILSKYRLHFHKPSKKPAWSRHQTEPNDLPGLHGIISQTTEFSSTYIQLIYKEHNGEIAI